MSNKETSSGTKNQTYFYMGADHGLSILILVILIIAFTTLIGTLVLMLAN